MPIINCTGIGANCGSYHRNCSDRLHCTTTVQFSVAGGEQQAVRMMKRWLLDGLQVPPDSPTARSDHHAMRRAALARTYTAEEEALMDQEAARMLADS